MLSKASQWQQPFQHNKACVSGKTGHIQDSHLPAWFRLSLIKTDDAETETYSTDWFSKPNQGLPWSIWPDIPTFFFAWHKPEVYCLYSGSSKQQEPRGVFDKFN